MQLATDWLNWPAFVGLGVGAALMVRWAYVASGESPEQPAGVAPLIALTTRRLSFIETDHFRRPKPDARHNLEVAVISSVTVKKQSQWDGGCDASFICTDGRTVTYQLKKPEEFRSEIARLKSQGDR